MRRAFLTLAVCFLSAPLGAQDGLYYPKPGEPWETRPIESAGGAAGEFARFLDYSFSRGEFGTEPHKTNALIVLLDGRILHEEYARGFASDDRHYLWSLSKSLANGILGRAERMGIVSRGALISDHLPGFDDPKARGLTLAHLMQMSSGVRYNEENAKNILLSNSIYVNYAWRGFEGVTSYMRLQGFQHPAGKQFNYSSGDCNLSMAVLRQRFDDPAVNKGADPQTAYNAFPWRHLFSKIGMDSTTLEQDGSGVFKPGSFGWSSARDMARFALLYLRNGAWDINHDGEIAEDETLFRPDWVAFSTSVAPSLTDKEFLVAEDHWRLNRESYGAFWWLNRPIAASGNRSPYPNLPETAFIGMGFRGQTLVVMPSRKLIVVRLGSDPLKGKINRHRFYRLLMASLSVGTGRPLPGVETTTGYDFSKARELSKSRLGELFLRSLDDEIVFDDPFAMGPAKDLCSCLFVMKKDDRFCAADVVKLDLLRNLGLATKPVIDRSTKSVTVSNRMVPLFDHAPLLRVLGPSTHTATASYVNEDLGCMISTFTAPWRGPLGILNFMGDQQLTPSVNYFDQAHSAGSPAG